MFRFKVTLNYFDGYSEQILDTYSLDTSDLFSDISYIIENLKIDLNDLDSIVVKMFEERCV